MNHQNRLLALLGLFESSAQFSIPNWLVRQMLQKDPEICLSLLKRRKVEKRRHPHLKRPSIIVSV